MFSKQSPKKKAWDFVTPETIQTCFKRCCFHAGNEGKDGRFISFLYICAGVTNCQKFAFLLNNKMLVTVMQSGMPLQRIYWKIFRGMKKKSKKSQMMMKETRAQLALLKSLLLIMECQLLLLMWHQLKL